MKTSKRVILGLLFALAGCDNAPTSGKAGATVNEAVAPAPVALTAGSAQYRFSQADSKIEFVGAKVTGKHLGSFSTFQGNISGVAGDVTKSTVSSEIDIASLVADNPKLTAHLKSADLLDAAQYPKARFTSTSIVRDPSRADGYTVTGNFELHGVTKSIGFPATIQLSPQKVDVAAEFGINRKDFGIVYPGMPDDLIKDEVLLKLQIHAAADTGTASK